MRASNCPTNTTNIPDVLHLFVHRGISNNYVDIEENYDTDGSHMPIIGTISTTVIKKETSSTLYNATTDWYSYQQWLENDIHLKIP